VPGGLRSKKQTECPLRIHSLSTWIALYMGPNAIRAVTLQTRGGRVAHTYLMANDVEIAVEITPFAAAFPKAS
jgi:hypothetical protein